MILILNRREQRERRVFLGLLGGLLRFERTV